MATLHFQAIFNRDLLLTDDILARANFLQKIFLQGPICSEFICLKSFCQGGKKLNDNMATMSETGSWRNLLARLYFQQGF